MNMTREQRERRSAVWRWTLAGVTCLGAAGALLALGTVAPVFLDHSVAGIVARLALCSFCLAFFVSAHRGIRRALIDCDRTCSDEQFRQVPAP